VVAKSEGVRPSSPKKWGSDPPVSPKVTPLAVTNTSYRNSDVVIIEEMTFFSNRIVNLWNNLPPSTTDFTSFNKFDESLRNGYLLLYCKLNFM